MRQPWCVPMRSPRLLLDELASVAERFDDHRHNRLVTYEDGLRWKADVRVALDRYILQTTCCLYQVANVKVSGYIRRLLAARCLQFFHPLSRVALGQHSSGNLHSLRGFLLPRSYAARKSTVKIAIHIAQLDIHYATWLPASAIHEYGRKLGTKMLDKLNDGIVEGMEIEDDEDEDTGNNKDAQDRNDVGSDGQDEGIEERLFCWQVAPEGRAAVLVIVLHAGAMLASLVTALHNRRPVPSVTPVAQAASALDRATELMDQIKKTNSKGVTTELPPATYDFFSTHAWRPLVGAIDQQVRRCVTSKIANLKTIKGAILSDEDGNHLTEISSTSGEASCFILGLNTLLSPQDLRDSLSKDTRFLNVITQTAVRILAMFVTLPSDLLSAEVSELRRSLYTFLQKFLKLVNDALHGYIKVLPGDETRLKEAISASLKNILGNGPAEEANDFDETSKSVSGCSVQQLPLRSRKAIAKKAPRREHLLETERITRNRSDDSNTGRKIIGKRNSSEVSKFSLRTKRVGRHSVRKKRRSVYNRKTDSGDDWSSSTVHATRAPVGRKTIPVNLGSNRVHNIGKDTSSDSDVSYQPDHSVNSARIKRTDQLHSLDNQSRITYFTRNARQSQPADLRTSKEVTQTNRIRHPVHAVGCKEKPLRHISEEQEKNADKSDSEFNSQQQVHSLIIQGSATRSHGLSSSDSNDLAKRERVVAKSRLYVRLAAVNVDIESLNISKKKLEGERKRLESEIASFK